MNEKVEDVEIRNTCMKKATVEDVCRALWETYHAAKAAMIKWDAYCSTYFPRCAALKDETSLLSPSALRIMVYSAARNSPKRYTFSLAPREKFLGEVGTDQWPECLWETSDPCGTAIEVIKSWRDSLPGPGG